MRNRAFIASLFLASVLILSGCGDGSSESTSQSADQSQNSSSTGNNSQSSNNQSSSSASQNSADGQLRLNLAEGQVVQLNLMMEDLSKESAFGNEITRTTTTEVSVQFEVVGVSSSGSMDIIASYERYKETTEAVGDVDEYDSASDTEPVTPEDKILSGLMDQSFSFTISPLGEVTEISNLDEWLSRQIAQIEEVSRPLVSSFFEGLIGQSALLNLVDMAFLRYSPEAQEVGDTWQIKSVSGPDVPFQMVRDLTIESISADTATISVNAVVQKNPDAEPVMIGPSVMEHNNLQGGQQGTITVDLTTGVILSGTINENISAELQLVTEDISIEVEDDPIPISGTSVITYNNQLVSGD